MSEIVYKYLPPERVTYFEDELLRFTQPSDLNDPFECIPAAPSTKETELLMREISTSKIKDQILNDPNLSPLQKSKIENSIKGMVGQLLFDLDNSKDNLRSQFIRNKTMEMNCTIGLFSVSKKSNNTLMWSHYAEAHKGFCVGFDKNNPIFSGYLCGNTPMPIRNVSYSENRISIPLEDNKADFEFLFRKSKDWEYEEEYRLIGLLQLATKRIKNPKNSLFDIYLFRLPHDAIKEIIIGANTADPLTSKIIQFCSVKHIPLYKSEPSEFSYDMERHPLKY